VPTGAVQISRCGYITIYSNWGLLCSGQERPSGVRGTGGGASVCTGRSLTADEGLLSATGIIGRKLFFVSRLGMLAAR
jgi:hypothetical protein